jgi:hypothetical protein
VKIDQPQDKEEGDADRGRMLVEIDSKQKNKKGITINRNAFFANSGRPSWACTSDQRIESRLVE